jgi:hypothetical protein
MIARANTTIPRRGGKELTMVAVAAARWVLEVDSGDMSEGEGRRGRGRGRGLGRPDYGGGGGIMDDPNNIIH